MGDAAPVFRRGEILLAGELLGGGDVPQPEFGFQAAVALPGHAAGDQRLGVDGLPVLELGRGVDIGDLLDEGRRVDRREQSAALEVIGDDLGDADADLGVRRRARHEVRDRDRQRRGFAAAHGNAYLPERAIHATQNQAARRQARQELPAAHAERRVGRIVLF